MEGTGEVSWKLLNLASLESIEKCSNSILADESRIDLLVLNAGYWYRTNHISCNLKICNLIGVLSMSDSTKRTSDGFELHIGINFLGHYALTRRLLKLMRCTAKCSTDGVRFGLWNQKPNLSLVCWDDGSLYLTELWQLLALCIWNQWLAGSR